MNSTSAKIKRCLLLTLTLFLAFVSNAQNELVVAKDGSGNFTTIQEALNSIPTDNASWKTILVRNGSYDEHVMIKSNFVALVGESQTGTHIETSLSRTAWYNGGGNGANTGAGVVNVASNLHDIIIANLFIRNTYEATEDYTEVIRAETGTTRIWVVQCQVLCLHKDTFAPWGKNGGMYYVSDCTFRGSIDAFCPRGWCYALNCRFIETKSSSPIWHEGVATEDQRLVIQGGSVHSEYNKQVKLQNSQNYAKFYYLDVHFSDSIAELGKSATQYFYNNRGLNGLTWYADNITAAVRKPMDAAWTFGGNWDPENTFPSVLPFASLPQPYDGRYAISAGTLRLKWTKAKNSQLQKVYFGTSQNPPLLGETTTDTMVVSGLVSDTTYYWSIQNGAVAGKVWRFSTANLPQWSEVQDTTVTPPPDTSSIDFTTTRLNRFPASLNCLSMSKEPAWIVRNGSVSWTSGTGYKWGSSSASTTVKVAGCSLLKCSFLNGSTSRPILISDGGVTNDITAYPTAANVETVASFVPKSLGEVDISIKTAGSSGMIVSKMNLSGNSTDLSESRKPLWWISEGIFHAQEPVDIYALTGETLVRNATEYPLKRGFYIIRTGRMYAKLRF